MGDLLCGFEIAPGRVCKRPAPCSVATHLVSDPDAMLATAREAAARGKAPAPSLEAMDRADAAADAIEIETDPTGWQPAELPYVHWGGVAEWAEINSAVWAGAMNDPGRVEECLSVALGALGSIAGRTSADAPTHYTAANALRRMRQRAEQGGPLPAYPRGPHV